MATAEATQEKVEKVAYPAVANGQLLKDIPDDFKTNLHLPLKESNFASDCTHKYWDWQAEKLEKRAKGMRNKAEAHRRMGAFKDKKKAAQVVKLQQQYQELMQQMAAAGEPIDQLTVGG